MPVACLERALIVVCRRVTVARLEGADWTGRRDTVACLEGDRL